MSLRSSGLLAEWQGQVMLLHDSFIVRQITPHRISNVVGALIRFCINLQAEFCANFVKRNAQAMQTVALNQNSRKSSGRVAEDSRVRRV
jgi:hypothetical protein